MNIHNYFNPVKIVFGIDSFNEIGDLAEIYCENKRILFITDKNLLKILGIQKKLTNLIQKKDLIIRFRP